MSSKEKTEKERLRKERFAVNYAENRRLYLGKVFFLALFILLDIAFNSIADHDSAFTDDSLREIILAGQVITEILIFIVFFLLLSGTYLFQVGLIGQLSKYLLPVFYSFPLYLGLTIWSGFARDSILRGDKTHIVDLWGDKNFWLLFMVHKLMAAIFYVIILRISIRLGEPIFYSGEPWMRLYQRQPALFLN